ncbi:MAG: D-alanyl-D-alanine carboxypeptidase [Clostridia bacterium]|nr:D-alanyl-D-alanine carboxypeptidase [Clostridia bacterium]
MNKKAEELGLKNTHFVTPHGLDDNEHYTTAYELAVLTDYALKNEKFAQIVNTKTCTINVNGMPRQITNTNELLGNLNGVNGVKTGFTGNAMRCLVTSCTRNGNQIITVVLGADTKNKRTEDSIKLIEYAFSNYERINLEEIAKKEFEKWKQINEKRIYINKAENKKVELILNEIQNKKIPIKKGSEKDIKIEINCIYEFEAPLPKLTKVGNLIIKNKEEIIETIDIQTKEQIEKKKIINYMFQFFENLPTCLDFYK